MKPVFPRALYAAVRCTQFSLVHRMGVAALSKPRNKPSHVGCNFLWLCDAFLKVYYVKISQDSSKTNAEDTKKSVK